MQRRLKSGSVNATRRTDDAKGIAGCDNVPVFSTLISHHLSVRDFLHPTPSRKITRGKSRNRTARARSGASFARRWRCG